MKEEINFGNFLLINTNKEIKINNLPEPETDISLLRSSGGAHRPQKEKLAGSIGPYERQVQIYIFIDVDLFAKNLIKTQLTFLYKSARK